MHLVFHHISRRGPRFDLGSATRLSRCQTRSIAPFLGAKRLVQAIELRDGIYYPMGGFGKVVKGLEQACRDLGVQFRFGCPVEEVRVASHAAPP